MLIMIKHDYYNDLINVPDSIAKNIKKYQNKFDKWLHDKSNNHPFWETDKFGKKLAAITSSEAFIYWINEFVLSDSKQKAVLYEENTNVYDELIPKIWF